MPHLILSFSAERNAEEPFADHRGRNVSKGLRDKEHIEFKVIDTDKGTVVELAADAFNVKQEERPPTHAELHAASQVLGKEPGKNIALQQFEQVSAERDSYRQKHIAAEATISTQERKLKAKDSEIRELRKKIVDDDEKKLMTEALDSLIIQLAAEKRFEDYDHAKKIYRKVSGEKWLEDDDEEGD